MSLNLAWSLKRESALKRQFLDRVAEARAGEKAAVGVVLARRRGAKTIRQLIEIALGRADNCARDVTQMVRLDATRPIACKKGCSTCCILKISTIAPEAIYMAEHLRAHLSSEGLADVVERVVRLDDYNRTLAEDAPADARRPCALLVDDCCSIYPARPFACRWATSPSLEACVDTFVHDVGEGVSIDAARMLPLREVWGGMMEGLREAGLEADVLEMTAGLRVALEGPDIAIRWLAGERVFASAIGV